MKYIHYSVFILFIFIIFVLCVAYKHSSEYIVWVYYQEINLLIYTVQPQFRALTVVITQKVDLCVSSNLKTDNSLKNVGKLMRLIKFLHKVWIWSPVSLFPFHLTYLCSGTDQGTTETQQKCFLMHVVAMIFCKLNIKESHLSKKDRCIKANLNYVQQLIKYRSTGENAFN